MTITYRQSKGSPLSFAEMDENLTELAAGILHWAVKTGAVTATHTDQIVADVTSGSFTITLPAAPTNNQWVSVMLWLGGTTNTVTIDPGSVKIMGINSTFGMSTGNAVVTLVYIDSTKGWIIA